MKTLCNSLLSLGLWCLSFVVSACADLEVSGYKSVFYEPNIRKAKEQTRCEWISTTLKISCDAGKTVAVLRVDSAPSGSTVNTLRLEEFRSSVINDEGKWAEEIARVLSLARSEMRQQTPFKSIHEIEIVGIRCFPPKFVERYFDSLRNKVGVLPGKMEKDEALSFPVARFVEDSLDQEWLAVLEEKMRRHFGTIICEGLGGPFVFETEYAGETWKNISEFSDVGLWKQELLHTYIISR